MLSPRQTSPLFLSGAYSEAMFWRVSFPLASFGAIAFLFSERNTVSKLSALTMNRFTCGAISEIIVEGGIGFIVEDIDRAVEAVGKIEQISRAACRRKFEQRFTNRHMAEDYIRIYQQLLSRSSTQAAA